jgi:hypothetical protein
MSANPFVGTWRLVSGETKTASGEISHPLGKDATGYLIYSSDGYMAVAIMQANRSNFASTDTRGGGLEEKGAAFDTYVSYSGTYEVKGERVIHHVEMSLFPNWSGTDQERFFVIAEVGVELPAYPLALLGSRSSECSCGLTVGRQAGFRTALRPRQAPAAAAFFPDSAWTLPCPEESSRSRRSPCRKTPEHPPLALLPENRKVTSQEPEEYRRPGFPGGPAAQPQPCPGLPGAQTPAPWKPLLAGV